MKRLRFGTLALIAFVALALILLAWYFLSEDPSQTILDLQHRFDGRELDDETFEAWERGEEEIELEPREVKEIWRSVHHMSHHVSLAHKQWGLEPLTLERINYLIVEVHEAEITGEQRDELLDILHRWRRGDFSQADRDHNMVWRRLGGTVGWSYGVNEEGIPDWARELQKEQ